MTTRLLVPLAVTTTSRSQRRPSQSSSLVRLLPLDSTVDIPGTMPTLARPWSDLRHSQQSSCPKASPPPRRSRTSSPTAARVRPPLSPPVLPHHSLADSNPPAEFVLTVASEANEICEKDSKKTMLPDHVVNALKVLRPPLTRVVRAVPVTET